MADDLEQIEARLAAYIDDALPEPARAEIEQYLANNPSHKQLVGELRAQRARIARLPRENAPAEVMDHLQDHLERQALLSNVDEAASSLKVNRWPQWTALAAVLLLTAGLGMLIYSVLPHSNRDTYVIAPPAVQGLPDAPSLDVGESAREKKFREEASSELAKAENERSALARKTEASPLLPSPEEVKPPPIPPAVAALPPTAEQDKQDKDASLADSAAAPAAKPQGLADSPDAAAGRAPATPLPPVAAVAAAERQNQPMATLNVSTDDAALTQSLIAGYLAQNGIEFRVATSASDEIAAASQPTAALDLPRSAATQAQAPATGAPADVVRVGNAAATSSPAMPSEANLASKAKAMDVLQTPPATLLIDRARPEQVESLVAAIASQRGQLQQVVRVETTPARAPADASPSAPDQEGMPATIPAAEEQAVAPTSLPASPQELQVVIVISPTEPGAANVPVTLPPPAPPVTQPATQPALP